MPFPSLPRTPSGPRRRTLLASAAGAALLVGCSGGEDSAEERRARPTAADRVRQAAARDSADLLTRYDAVLAAHPALTARLTPLRAEVVRHVSAFGGAPARTATPAPTAATSTPGGTPSPSSSPSSSPSPVVPVDEKGALGSLAGAERTLSDRRITALADADVPGELARLLASVAAAGSAHAYLLTEGNAR
ncbi:MULTISPECIES: hypothetical protein [unclassified Streptomyces]|uniref:hypothetical protein n=1 Tax=unclassified Streptomyces TaxID=2593676 RepID=UPI00381FAEB9